MRFFADHEQHELYSLDLFGLFANVQNYQVLVFPAPNIDCQIFVLIFQFTDLRNFDRKLNTPQFRPSFAGYLLAGKSAYFSAHLRHSLSLYCTLIIACLAANSFGNGMNELPSTGVQQAVLT